MTGVYSIYTVITLIRTFKHKGLKRLFTAGDSSKVLPDQVSRISSILFNLDVAVNVQVLDLPGYNLHRLRGDMSEYWSVKVSGNWRIIFKMKDAEIYDVDLVDYH